MNNNLDEDLRAPIATTTGVLSEDPLGMLQTSNRGIRERGFNKKTPTSVFDTFRDFKRESQILEASNDHFL